MSELWNVFFSQEPVGTIVNVIIGALFLLGCLDVWRGRQRLSRELALVRGASQRLAEAETARSSSGQAGGDGGERKKFAASSSTDVLSFLGVSEESHLGRRIARMIDLRTAGLGQRSALQSLTLEGIEGYGAGARYLATILTILGLLGTVFGLTMAMFRIQGAFGTEAGLAALTALTEALGGTLEGMKTAFGCTMAGLLSALLLSGLNHFLRRYQSLVASRIEEFVTCQLMPAVETVDPEANNAARAFATALAEGTEQMSSVGAGLTEVANSYRDSSTVISNSVTSLNQAVNNFSNSLTQLSGNQETFSATMQETQTAVSTLQKTIEEQLRELRALSERSHELLDKRLRDLEAAAETNKQTLETMHAYHKEFSVTADKLSSQFSKLVEATRADLKETMATSVSAIAKGVRDEVAKLLAEEKRSMSGVVEAQTTALRSFSDMVFKCYGLDGSEAKQ